MMKKKQLLNQFISIGQRHICLFLGIKKLYSLQYLIMEFLASEMQTHLDFFYEWEKKQPNATFLRQPYGRDWKQFTWREVGEQARRMATALQNLGLQQGDKVGIVSKNCYHWIIADLAIMMGKFVSAPFYPTLTAAQLNEVVLASEAKVLFVGKLDDWAQLRLGIPAGVQLITFPHYPGNAVISEGLSWERLISDYQPIQGNPTPGINDLWTIIFTSGTTGAPKGVMLNYFQPAALMHNEAVHNNLNIFSGKEHRFFSYLPLNHIAERIIVEGAAMQTGGTISFGESLETFARNLQETQPTLFMSVPRIWTKFQLGILHRLPEAKLNLLLKIPIIGALLRQKIRKSLGMAKARIMLTGAAPTPDSVKDFFQKIGMNLQEVYAMTENAGGCTLMPANGLVPGSVGKILPGVALRIDAETGEISMKAPWVMNGYYNDPQKTREVLQDGWLRTGDQGEMASNGYLKITGRVSDTFKTAKGKFISPAPMEWGFAENHFIEQVCVLGMSVPQPLALAVLSEIGLEADPEEVTESLRQTLVNVNADLANFEKIKTLVIVKEPWGVENGVLTPTMKIRRNELNRRYADLLPKWYDQSDSVLWEKPQEAAILKIV
jgi:long-subunit acyl-CoA synthetase (AMP-forming)